MAQLTSEAEFERLYQEFVRRNGGIPTLVADQYNTPAQFYDASQNVSLSPADLAALQARQYQYNRQAALNTISQEITNNNFTNPYNARSQASISNLNSISAQSITITDAATDQTIKTTSYNQLGGVRDSLSPLSDSSIGGSAALAAMIYAGVADATGIDLGKLILGAGLITAGVAMFGNLQNHTDGQVADLPGKMGEIDQLTGLQQSFGEMSSDSCSIFNELMGILSGSFDGVLDFIDSGIEKFKDLMASTSVGQIFNQVKGAIDGIMGQITSQISAIMGPINGIIDQITAPIQGLIDNVKGLISDAIGPIMNQIDSVLGPMKDIMGNIGDLASGLLDGIGSIADQIAGEIQGLIDMAADIAAKVQALAIAGMMMDPCKMAVLLNTGSPALAGAANQLTAPLESAMTGIDIPTEIDSRADPAAVNAAVQTAQRDAKTQPGVPQSPINALAQLYSPFSAYLNDMVQTVQGIFGGAYETVNTLTGGQLINKVPETLGANPDISSLGSITNNLQGTIGDISNNVGSLASGSPMATSASTNATGDNTDNEDFSTGGNTNPEAPATEGTVSSRLDGKDGTIRRAKAENKEVARVVEEETAEGTVRRTVGPSQQIAAAKKDWQRQYSSKFLRVLRDNKKEAISIKTYLAKAKFKNAEQKREAELLYEDCQRLKNDITKWTNSYAKKFQYRSPTQDRDTLQEDRIRSEFESVGQSQNSMQLSRFKQELYDIQSGWGSIKRQAILG